MQISFPMFSILVSRTPNQTRTQIENRYKRFIFPEPESLNFDTGEPKANLNHNFYDALNLNRNQTDKNKFC